MGLRPHTPSLTDARARTSARARDEIKEQILKAGIRKLERETKVSHHTIDRILKGENVRRKTLAKVVNGIE